MYRRTDPEQGFLIFFICILTFSLFQNVLEIRKDVFGEKNLCVAMVHEDLGYASYVQEYSSGEFENAKYDHVYTALHFFIVACLCCYSGATDSGHILRYLFISFRHHAQMAIDIISRLLPQDHLLLASSKRVKGILAVNVVYGMVTLLKHPINTSIFSVALVLEEIAIDRDLEEEKLVEAQKLHLASLRLAR